MKQETNCTPGFYLTPKPAKEGQAMPKLKSEPIRFFGIKMKRKKAQ